MGKKFDVTLEILVDGEIPLVEFGGPEGSEISLFKGISVLQNEKMIRTKALRYLHYFDSKEKVMNKVVSGNIIIRTKYKNQCTFAKYIRRNKKFVYQKNTNPYVDILLA
jgi:hypothetical protein